MIQYEYSTLVEWSGAGSQLPCPEALFHIVPNTAVKSVPETMPFLDSNWRVLHPNYSTDYISMYKLYQAMRAGCLIMLHSS